MGAILSPSDDEDLNTVKYDKQVSNDLHRNLGNRKLCKKRMKDVLKNSNYFKWQMNRKSGSDTTEERKNICINKLKCTQREPVRNYDSS